MKVTTENGNPSQHPATYDVIIAGAGPVGLFLACELALTGCSVLILEKAGTPHSPLKQLPFGIRGLSAPSIEALHRRGLLDALEVPKRLKDPFGRSANEALPHPGRPVGHFAGIPIHQGHIDTSQWKYRLPGARPTSLIAEMAELESVLTRRAETLGVTICRGLPITDFLQTKEVVTVLSGDLSFTGKWLVGCDGSRSIVRKSGGFEFAGTEPAFTGYSVKADIIDPEKLKPGRVLTPRGMYFQSQPGYLAIQDFDGGAFHRAGQPVTLERVQQLLRHISDTDVTISALHIATTWTDHARQATAYRNGRVLLAGDAAHIHAPLGGQGLNLGLGDAMNLGWKLGAVIQKNAPEALLDSYHAERYPVGAQVLDWSRAQVEIMKPTPNAHALHAILRDLVNTGDGATYIAGRLWGVHMHYDLDGVHPLVGYSVPAFTFEDGTTPGDVMHDGRGLLLDLTNNSELNTFADEYAPQLKYIAGPVKDRLGINALLIRPDGIVAWATDDTPDYNALREAAARWFVVNRASRINI